MPRAAHQTAVWQQLSLPFMCETLNPVFSKFISCLSKFKSGLAICK